MNNPNPFVPKGSLLEQQSQRRSRLKLVVFCVLTVSVAGLVVMLIQGCKRENPEAQPAVDTNNMPPLEMPTNPPAMDTNVPPAPAIPTNAYVIPPVVPPPVAPVVETPAAGGTYEVVSGDTLAKIAKKNGVSLKALEAANPGVDPKKLKPKMKLNLPASTKGTESASVAPAGAATSDVSSGGETYVVKSGDTLSKIAKRNHISVKTLRAANSKLASTDHIKVGDKLTIPAKTEAAAAAPAPTPDTSVAPVLPPPAVPAPAPAPAPGH